MIIYGASGHAKVIIDIIQSTDNQKIDFIFDDNPAISELLLFQVEHEWNKKMDELHTVIAIGNNLIRKKVSQQIKNDFCDALIHKSAIISKQISIGKGTVVMPNAVINSSSQIRRHCIINSGAVVEHDVIIEDFVHISPSATITGNVYIGEGSHIGAGATIIPGLKIGKWVTIGAGAVIIGDIPDYSVVVGNPGKIIKYNFKENEQ